MKRKSYGENSRTDLDGEFGLSNKCKIIGERVKSTM